MGETIGWLRHSEIKHGRVAMAGFVGYCLQANGVKFPWAPFDAITATSPPEQWYALPDAAKWQIILGVGFLEWWSEIRFDGTPHYMKGAIEPDLRPPLKEANAKDDLPLRSVGQSVPLLGRARRGDCVEGRPGE